MSGCRDATGEARGDRGALTPEGGRGDNGMGSPPRNCGQEAHSVCGIWGRDLAGPLPLLAGEGDPGDGGQGFHSMPVSALRPSQPIGNAQRPPFSQGRTRVYAFVCAPSSGPRERRGPSPRPPSRVLPSPPPTRRGPLRHGHRRLWWAGARYGGHPSPAKAGEGQTVSRTRPIGIPALI